MPELERPARLVGVEDQLDQSGAVAQVDEDESAVVAAAVHPAGDPHLRVDAVGQRLAAPGVSVLVRPQGREAIAHSRAQAPINELRAYFLCDTRGIDLPLLP